MTNTERPLHYFITEADDYRAWAGDGPYAEALLASGRTDAMTEFQSRVSDALYEHAGDFDRIDTEVIAREILMDVGRIDPDWATDETPMDLHDHNTGERIRRATAEEVAMAILSNPAADGSASAMEIDGRLCDFVVLRCDECSTPFDGPMFDDYDIEGNTWTLCQDCGADVSRIRDREANH